MTNLPENIAVLRHRDDMMKAFCIDGGRWLALDHNPELEDAVQYTRTDTIQTHKPKPLEWVMVSNTRYEANTSIGKYSITVDEWGWMCSLSGCSNGWAKYPSFLFGFNNGYKAQDECYRDLCERVEGLFE